MSIMFQISFLYWFISNILLMGFFVYDSHVCPCICVVFNQHSDYIETRLYDDLEYTEFTIVKKGFETDEKRKEAVNEYFSNRRDTYPSFFVNYSSHEPTKKVQNMDTVGCSEVVTLDDFRKGSLFFYEVYFVKESQNDSYIVWKAQLWAEE